MKAFKQINLNIENRLVFSYAAILCFLCSFIILNPLFGQTNEEHNPDKPEVQIDVNKEYDENGNVIGYDSTYKWFWSGKEITDLKIDSIFEKLHNDFDHWNDNLERDHFKPFGYFNSPGENWNHLDSSLYSDLDDLFNDELLDRFDFNHDHLNFYDSTITSFLDLAEFNHKFNMDEFLGKHEFLGESNSDQEDYIERFKEYQKEHQKLIEKYFGDPIDKNDSDIKVDQNKYSPKNIKIESENTGRI